MGLGVVALIWFSLAATAMDGLKLMGLDEEPLKYGEEARPDRPGKPPKPPEPTPSNKWAVVIGIADYRGTGNDLWHPDEDAKEMAQVLQEKYGYTNIMLLTNKQATASAISKAIDWLVANTDAESQAVFFFSGHGYRAPDGDGWDSDSEADGQDEMIVTYDMYGLPDGWLKAKFAGIGTSHFTLLFGNCFSGGMFDDASDPGFGEGRVTASACAADQYGWDYLQLGNTLWGYYFVDLGMLDGEADTNLDSKVSVEEAHGYAQPLVVAMRPDSVPDILDNDESAERIP